MTNLYEILDEEGTFLFNLYADSRDEALAEAKQANRTAYEARFIERIRNP